MAAIVSIQPVPRNQGVQVPNAVSAAQWIDVLVLSAGVAKAYTLPVDSAGHKGHILRVTATAGPVYLQHGAAAVIPLGDITNGTGPVLLRTDLGLAYIIVVPLATEALSFICAGASTVVVEAWS